jgi:hypothetical protein
MISEATALRIAAALERLAAAIERHQGQWPAMPISTPTPPLPAGMCANCGDYHGGLMCPHLQATSGPIRQ